ncbi:MAG: single-stranded DNA-binding protein [Prevotella sp.]|nr:single-stranded DNA-binding protein [Prevotella sp.]
MNKVMLIGNVGAEPEVRYVDAGVAVARLRLATSERGYTLQNGTQVPERTDWHSVILWKKLAEVVEKYVHKGDKLYIEGRIRYTFYDDRQGQRRTATEIWADNMEMLTARNTAAPQADTNVKVAENPSAVAPSREEKDKDLPF